MGSTHVLLFGLRLRREERATGKGCEDEPFGETGEIHGDLMFISLPIYLSHLHADKSQKHSRKGYFSLHQED